MSRFSIERVDLGQLDFDRDPPFVDGDKRLKKEVRRVLKKHQTARIPVSIYSEVLDEDYHFYALLEAGYRSIEIVRLTRPALRWEITDAMKFSAKIPMGGRAKRG